MKLTTLCYLQRNQEILMLHRTKKEVDINQGKWIGVGGKLEPGESPDECVRREVLEETGLTLSCPKLRALITFNFLDPDPTLVDWDTEYTFVYTCDTFSGCLRSDCDEGDLAWIPIQQIGSLPQWEGDHLFLNPILAGSPFLSMKLVYRGDSLLRCETFQEEDIHTRENP